MSNYKESIDDRDRQTNKQRQAETDMYVAIWEQAVVKRRETNIQTDIHRQSHEERQVERKAGRGKERRAQVRREEERQKRVGKGREG